MDGWGQEEGLGERVMESKQSDRVAWISILLLRPARHHQHHHHSRGLLCGWNSPSLRR